MKVIIKTLEKMPKHTRGKPGAGMFMCCVCILYIYIYTLWLFNIAMENGPFIDGLPIKHGDFPWLC